MISCSIARFLPKHTIFKIALSYLNPELYCVQNLVARNQITASTSATRAGDIPIATSGKRLRLLAQYPGRMPLGELRGKFHAFTQRRVEAAERLDGIP